VKKGLLQFINYQTRGNFRIEEAIIAGAKAALLAARIKTGDASPLPVYEESMKKADYLLTQPEYIDLNKLQVEPLFYWHHAMRIMYPPSATAVTPAGTTQAASGDKKDAALRR